MSVKPNSVTETLDVGESTSVNKEVTTSDVLLVVTHKVNAQPGLSVTLTPEVERVPAGKPAAFKEKIEVLDSAAPGSRLEAKVHFLIDGIHHANNTQSIVVNVPKHATTLTVSDVTAPANTSGTAKVTLSARLIDQVTNGPVSGATIQFELNGEKGTGVTDDNGWASTQVLGPKNTGTYPINASFAGNDQYLASSGTGTATIYAYAQTGGFVIAAANAKIGNNVYFWGSQWEFNNPVPGASSSFKGYAVDSDNKCGGNFQGAPGNSGHPPSTVPELMAVIGTSSMNGDSGSIQTMVVVQVSTYGPDPGHPGTGQVIAIIC